MLIQSLKEKVHQLKKEYAEFTLVERLKDKIALAYANKVLHRLDSILSDSELTEAKWVNALDTYLQENAALTNHNALSYTTQLTPEITALLCDVAEYVYESVSPKGDERPLIKILLPSLKGLEPLAPLKTLYPDLAEMKDSSTLQQILKTHILGEKGNHLLPVRLIVEEKKKLENPYFDLFASEPSAVYVTGVEKERLKSHSSKTETMCYTINRRNLIQNDTSHFLGHLNAFIQALQYCSVSGAGAEERADDLSFKVIHDFFEYYDALGEERDKIPSNLQKEIDKIRHYSGSKDSFVIEKQHGEDLVLPNIDSCLQTRTDALISTKRPHQLLLASIGTSDLLRQTQLEKVEKELADLKGSFMNEYDEKQYQGQDTLGFNLDLLDTLEVSLNFNTLDDILHLNDFSDLEIASILTSKEKTHEILECIKNIENLVILSISLSPEKLTCLLTHLKSYLFDKESSWPSLTEIDDYVAYLIALDEKRSEVVFDLFQDEIKTLVVKGSDYCDLCHYLPDHLKHLFFQSFNSQLYAMINDFESFTFIAAELLPDDLTILCKNIKANRQSRAGLPEDATEHGGFFAYLSLGQIQSYLSEFKKHFLDVVINNKDQLFHFLDILVEEVPWFEEENDDEDIPLLFNEKINYLYQAFKEELKQCLTLQEQIDHFSEYLSEEEKHGLYEEVKKEGFSSLNNAKTVNYFYTVFSYEDNKDFYDRYKLLLNTMIMNADDLTLIFSVLDKSQRLEQLELIGDSKLDEIVASISNMVTIGLLMPKDKQLSFYLRQLEAKSSSIKSYKDYFLLLGALEDEHVDVILPLIAPRVSTLFLSSITPLYALDIWSKPQAFQLKVLLPVLKTMLFSMSAAEMAKFYSSLLSEDVSLDDNIQKIYRSYFKNTMKLARFYQCLDPFYRRRFVTEYHDYLIEQFSDIDVLSKFIQNTDSSELYRTDRPITNSECLRIVEESIETPSRLLVLLKNAYKGWDSSSSKLILDAYLKENKKDLTNYKLFKQITRLLYEKARVEAFDLISGALTEGVQTEKDLRLLYQYFESIHWVRTDSQYLQNLAILLDAINPNLNAIIKTPKGLNMYCKLVERSGNTITPTSIEAHHFSIHIDSWKAVSQLLRDLSITSIRSLLPLVNELDLSKDGFNVEAFLRATQSLSKETLSVLCDTFPDKLLLLFSSNENVCLVMKRLPREKMGPLFQFLKKKKGVDEDFIRELMDSLSAAGNSNTHRPYVKKISHLVNDSYLREVYDYYLLDKNESHAPYYRIIFDEAIDTITSKLTQPNLRLFSKKNAELISEINRLQKTHYGLAVSIIMSIDELLQDKSDTQPLPKKTEQALEDSHSALYQALNTHTSMIPITLYGPDGRFGFFSFDTNSLRRAREGVSPEDGSRLVYRQI